MSARIPAPGADRSLRLDLAPAGAGRRGALDGAWWPHSRNLAAELPTLVAGLDAWLDAPVPGHGAHLSRVSINLTVWDAVPAHIDNTGRRIRLSWFGTVDANTLSATCSDGSHLDLLVIPPAAGAEAARAAAATATDPANTQRSSTILARLMPDLLRGPDTARSWAGGTDEPATAASWDRRPGGPAHLLDDGDPDETEPPLTARWEPARSARGYKGRASSQ
jgi:hypothetical protein